MELLGVGERIKRVRGDMSLPDFAQSLSVHKSTIVRWEREENFPDAKAIRRMCELYDVKPTWLVLGEESLVMNWDLLESVLEEVLTVFDDFGLRLPATKKAKLITILCKQMAGKEVGEVDLKGAIADLIKIAS